MFLNSKHGCLFHVFYQYDCCFIKLSNLFGFPDPEPPIIKLLYRWYGIYSHFGLCVIVFPPVTSSKKIIF